MDRQTLTLWAEAADLARLAMGRLDERDPARALGSQWRADADPLAWWTLTELLHNFAVRRAHNPDDDRKQRALSCVRRP